MDRLQLRARKLHPDAQLPRFSHGPEEDAGMDLVSVEQVTLVPGERYAVATGLAIEIPTGFEGQVRPRSGLALKHGIGLLNAPGTIDPGYRGEVKVILMNYSDTEFVIRPGDRIAQLVIGAYAAVEWEVAESLEESARAARGVGSTGA